MLVSAAIASRPSRTGISERAASVRVTRLALDAAGSSQRRSTQIGTASATSIDASVASMAPPTFRPTPNARTVSATRAIAPLAYVTAIRVTPAGVPGRDPT